MAFLGDTKDGWRVHQLDFGEGVETFQLFTKAAEETAEQHVNKKEHPAGCPAGCQRRVRIDGSFFLTRR